MNFHFSSVDNLLSSFFLSWEKSRSSNNCLYRSLNAEKCGIFSLKYPSLLAAFSRADTEYSRPLDELESLSSGTRSSGLRPVSDGDDGGDVSEPLFGAWDLLDGEAGVLDTAFGELGRGIVTLGTITDLLAAALGVIILACSSPCAELKYSSKVLLVNPRNVKTVSAELCLIISAPRTCIDLRLESYNRVLRGGSLARGVGRGVAGIVTGDSMWVGDEGLGDITWAGSERELVGKSTLPSSSNNDEGGSTILESDEARASPGRGEIIWFVLESLSGCESVTKSHKFEAVPHATNRLSPRTRREMPRTPPWSLKKAIVPRCLISFAISLNDALTRLIENAFAYFGKGFSSNDTRNNCLRKFDSFKTSGISSSLLLCKNSKCIPVILTTLAGISRSKLNSKYNDRSFFNLPIEDGSCRRWFSCNCNSISAVSSPISLGSLSRRLSFNFNTLSDFNLPIFWGRKDILLCCKNNWTKLGK